MRILASIVLSGLLLTTALAHGWYDPDCCGDQDCEPVSATSYVSQKEGLPVLTVTTSFGTYPLTAETKIRHSKDNRMHACIFMDRLWCLYLPPGS